jgi:hypothetical protein
MRIEPQKMIKNIDLTCFKHVFNPTKSQNSSEYFIAGTADSYAKLIPFIENQIAMATEFGSATREIFFKEPIEFREPIKISALQFNEREIKLQYIKFLKIKTVASESHFNFSIQGGQMTIVCTIENLEEALETCKKRKDNHELGMSFLTGESAEIRSVALGDWLGID